MLANQKYCLIAPLRPKEIFSTIQMCTNIIKTCQQYLSSLQLTDYLVNIELIAPTNDMVWWEFKHYDYSWHTLIQFFTEVTKK